MKMLPATLFCLLTHTPAHAQGTWPRNPKTGKVKLRGSLPWPASAKMEAQRRALVRRWYLAKLTDFTPAEVDEQAAPDIGNKYLITYAGLPKATVLNIGEGLDKYILGCLVQLSYTPKALIYNINSFSLQKAMDVTASSEYMELADLLPKATPNEKAALAALRKRLTVALAGW